MHSSVGKQTNEHTFVNMSRWFSFARSWTLMTLCTIGMSLPLMLNTTTSPAGQQAGWKNTGYIAAHSAGGVGRWLSVLMCVNSVLQPAWHGRQLHKAT
jgi:hypothetical protein